ncbi:MAG: lipopolysaccharide heptosyltransferase II [Candidatus Omnitrophota bacterium]|jgi:lipopolysaccharide heptosyltransferase I|nr:MAG: lipopolysaccharide heptosyltransferase II [Candidatus Omnitrophota bacterium]
MKNILIIKPSALGDVIQATCMLPILKIRIPEIRISWLVFEENADVVLDHPLVDHVVKVKRRGSFFRRLPSLLRELREPQFDTVIDIQCLFRSAMLSFLTGCKRRIGYKNGREGSTYFYTETLDIPTRSMHAVEGYILLCEALGAKRLERIEFPLPIKVHHRNRVHALLAEHPIRRPLITICPTAKWETKRWPESYFAQLADELYLRTNGEIVLTGAKDETPIVDRITRQMNGKCLNLAGQLSIPELAALLEISDLFVGNDSAPMHLASAVGVKTVALFGPTDPDLTGPYDPGATVLKQDVHCRPCFQKRCNHIICLENLSPQTVIKACMDKLREQ